MDLVDRLLRLWAEPPPEGEGAVEAFRRVYADPVLVNGAPMSAAELVERARRLHAALEGLQLEVLDRVDAPGRVAIAHRHRGRHVGPLATPLGEVPATGRMVDSLAIDILTIADDRVTGIWVVGDELGRLLQLGAVTLAQPPPGAQAPERG
jgi:SnoaL-like polyketide cyclase